MELSTAVEIGKAYADLGDSVGRQWERAIEEFEANGSSTPIADSDGNPNAFSDEGYEAIRRFRRVLMEHTDYAEEFLRYVDVEIAMADGVLEEARS